MFLHEKGHGVLAGVEYWKYRGQIVLKTKIGEKATLSLKIQ